ncbi:hypothetical protein [Flavobacterium sp.]|jgi:hypothetical protein|uniref:hypothetical protein n=1 Tax=Flavobacterium sp. TaxID=239 RepID=UPI003BE2ED9D
MRKLLFAITLLSAFVSHSQEKKKKDFDNKKHEVKFGAIKMLAGTIFEGTYEYIYSKDFTFGSSIQMNFQGDKNYNENFSLTPFARFYFQETQEYGAKGFFVEGFAKYAIGKNNPNHFYEYNNYNAAAVGISLGKKWINHTGFVFELLVGGGRTLGNSDVAPDGFFRGDINIGYRF